MLAIVCGFGARGARLTHPLFPSRTRGAGLPDPRPAHHIRHPRPAAGVNRMICRIGSAKGACERRPRWILCSPHPCRRRRRCAPPSVTALGSTRPWRWRGSSPPPSCRRPPSTASPRPRAASSTTVRRERLAKGGIDAFLHEYALSSQEGVALMCLAEALLRIPDAGDRRPADPRQARRGRLGAPSRPFGSLFVNASTWALMLTGRLLRPQTAEAHDLARRPAPPRRALGRAGGAPGGDGGDAHPRPPVRHGPHHRGGARARRARPSATATAIPTTCSARRRAPRPTPRAISPPTTRDRRDRRAPPQPGRSSPAPGISVKLSALHPRYEMAQRERVLRRAAAVAAGAGGAGARRRHRLHHRRRGGRPARSVARPRRGIWRSPPTSPAGTGSASRCRPIRSARCRSSTGSPISPGAARRRLMVRLVKGAYWDSEIKRGQERGLDGYPVFTRKLATDVSYLACAQRLLAAARPSIRNSRRTTRTPLAAVLELAGGRARLGVPAPARHGRGALRRDRRPGSDWTGPAASMRRSAATRICSPIWCGGCSRTAPTPRSSTASSTSGADRRDRRRSGRAARRAAGQAASAHPAAARSLSAGAAEFARARPRRPAALAGAARRAAEAVAPTVARRADRRRGRAAGSERAGASIRATAGARSAPSSRPAGAGRRALARAASRRPVWERDAGRRARRHPRARRRSLRTPPRPS